MLLCCARAPSLGASKELLDSIDRDWVHVQHEAPSHFIRMSLFFFFFTTGMSIIAARIARNFQGLPGNYCWTADNFPLCCSSRQDDSCKRTVRGLTCYCDNFCFERAWYPDDCCPDFFEVCHGIRSAGKNASLPSLPHVVVDFYDESDVSRAKAKPISPYDTERDPKPAKKSSEQAIELHKKTIKPDKILSSLKLSGFSRAPCTSKASCDIGSSCMKGCNICYCELRENRLQQICTNWKCASSPLDVSAINRKNLSWKAFVHSQFAGLTLLQAWKKYTGTSVRRIYSIPAQQNSSRHGKPHLLTPSFDARIMWPQMISEIKSQNKCGSSWAFSTAAVISDRLAIRRVIKNPPLSELDLLFCFRQGKSVCKTASIERVWNAVRKKGLSSSFYDSNFSNRAHNSTAKCKKKNCIEDCQRVKNYLRKNREYRLSMNEQEIRREIMRNGPVQAIMRIYPDFFLFNKGVYQTVFNTSDHKHKFKFHAIRIIGWGVIKGLKYWIVANSWGKSWGNKGYFRIVRGKNECDIEKYLIAC